MLSGPQVYIKAQKQLEIAASLSNLHYAYGAAFSIDRPIEKSVMIIPELLVNCTVCYSLYINKTCILASTDLQLIMSTIPNE